MENELLFKTQRNECVSLWRKCDISYFQDVTKKGLVINKSFWGFVKPFLTSKSCHTQNDIMLIDNGKVIVEENDLVEKFNDHYINIVEKSSGQKLCNFVSDTNSLEDDVVINEIVQLYSNHPRILKIKENFDNSQTVEQFQFNSVTTSELLKNINVKKATGTNKIPPKLVKISAEVLSQPLADAINNSISKGVFPDNANIASVSPIDKQSDDKNKVSNFRPVRVLKTFSKIYESVIKNQLISVLNNIFSPFLSAYRESYSTQHVLIRLLEKWRENLDNNYTMLMDFSKAFDCIPHDILIPKLSVYGLNGNALKYIYTYLKNRKPCVRVNNVCSDFKDIIPGVPRGSVVKPMLFNAFLNDFFFRIRKRLYIILLMIIRYHHLQNLLRC